MVHAAVTGGATWLCLASDGIDGNSEAAGAVVRSDSAKRAAQAGLDLAAAAAQGRSAEPFATLGDLLITGATGTNVCDLLFVVDTTPA